MSDNAKKEDKDFKTGRSKQQPAAENNRDKPEKKPGERRGGEARRKFSYGYQGHERRRGFDRRKRNGPPD
jgi:hypothetical protein